jgi:hypothetical protein
MLCTRGEEATSIRVLFGAAGLSVADRVSGLRHCHASFTHALSGPRNLREYIPFDSDNRIDITSKLRMMGLEEVLSNH